jgi:hypothetical protein
MRAEWVSPSLELRVAHTTRPQTPWSAGTRGGLSLVARLPRLLSGLQKALPEQGGAGQAIALALEPLQTGDLPLHGSITPRQGEPRGDRGQILLQPAGEAGQRIDAAVGGRRRTTPSVRMRARRSSPDRGRSVQ